MNVFQSRKPATAITTCQIPSFILLPKTSVPSPGNNKTLIIKATTASPVDFFFLGAGLVVFLAVFRAAFLTFFLAILTSFCKLVFTSLYKYVAVWAVLWRIAKIFKCGSGTFFMTESRINDLIFKELIKRGYSLHGNTRVWNIADSKLWYLTPEQAQAYLDLEDIGDYKEGMFKAELEMLKKYMPGISTKIWHGGAINVIDVGCGDGKKAIVPLDVLNKKTKVRYCPIDISSHMITQAIEEIRKLDKGEVVESKWNISDFDNLENVASLLRDPTYRQNFFIFLGDTISNFEINEVLYEVVEAMEEDMDYLLIGLTLATGNSDELVGPYQHEAIDNFQNLIVSQLGFGKGEVEFGVRFQNSRVEIFYTIKKDKVLEFGDKNVHFQKGDQILTAISYRHKLEDLKKILKIYFDEYEFYFNEDKTRALVLCKK
jgi:uncharacterized SAM-dependent methyltransferase